MHGVFSAISFGVDNISGGRRSGPLPLEEEGFGGRKTDMRSTGGFDCEIGFEEAERGAGDSRVCDELELSAE